MPVQVFGDLYTNGQGEAAKAVCYNLEQLDLRAALCRVNKVSDNGVALTFVVTLNSDIETKVSKNAAEKGTVAIKKSKGEVLVFDANISVTDDRKPGEKNGRCETLISVFRGRMTKDGKDVDLGIPATADGSIVLLTWDGPSIPMKGIQKLTTLKQHLADDDESIVFVELFDPVEGQYHEHYAIELEALQGSKYVERAAYQKGKTFDQTFEERLVYWEKAMEDPADGIIVRLVAVLGEVILWDEDLKRYDLTACPDTQSVLIGNLSL